MNRTDVVKVERVRTGIKAAFALLRKEGFVARMNFMCCSNCAGTAIANNLEKKGVDVDSANILYYHNQDNNMLNENAQVYIAHQGNTYRAVEVLKSCGLAVEWDGSDNTRLLVGVE